MAEAQRKFVLPRSVVGPVDVRRLTREVEALDDFMRQAAIRGGSTNTMPKVSHELTELTESNGLNLLQVDDRGKTARTLVVLHKSAPVLHISFAADPSASFVNKIIDYLRSNIHPYALVQIGLQPSIGAGCEVRLSSRVFDFSLRTSLLAKRELLTQALADMRSVATLQETK